MVITPVKGNQYKWKGQIEVLVYLGYNHDGRWWHQFALVNQPDVIWCEVTARELELIEAL